LGNPSNCSSISFIFASYFFCSSSFFFFSFSAFSFFCFSSVSSFFFVSLSSICSFYLGAVLIYSQSIFPFVSNLIPTIFFLVRFSVVYFMTCGPSTTPNLYSVSLKVFKIKPDAPRLPRPTNPLTSTTSLSSVWFLHSLFLTPSNQWVVAYISCAQLENFILTNINPFCLVHVCTSVSSHSSSAFTSSTQVVQIISFTWRPIIAESEI